jgi:flagellin-like protein
LHKDIYNLIPIYVISIMTKLHTKNKMTSRRAVAPVIATLLLVAIAVVGGSIIFVFSQGFFSSAQISGSPNIESVKILGYDATDGAEIIYHDGITGNATTGSVDSDGLKAWEYVGVYLKNDSVNKITVGELRIAGDIYTYVDGGNAALPDYTGSNGTGLVAGTFTLVDVGATDSTIDSSSATLEPGQQATLVFALEKDVKSGRDLQFKLQTAAGSVFVGTINSGQQSG